MEFDQFSSFSDDNFEDSINFRDIIEKYLKQWKWYLLSSLSLFLLAYFMLEKEAPGFEASATILIREVNKGTSVADLSSFEDLGLIRAGNNSLENEIYLLRSRRLMEKVVAELSLNTRFYINSSPYDIEVFPDFPLLLELENKNLEKDSLSIDINLHEDDPIDNLNVFFSISVISGSKYEYFNQEGETYGIKKFDEKINTDFGKIKISLNQTFIPNIVGKSIEVYINSPEFVAASYIDRIIVEPIDESSGAVKISIRENVIEKGLAIVNNLIEQYNADAVEDKNKVHVNTIEFLDSRIGLLTNELMVIERTAEQFQTQNRMVNVNSGVETFLSSSSDNENDLISANIQLGIVKYMIEELKNIDLNVTLPVNIGLSDLSITNIIGTYNDLVLRKNRILKSSSKKNPAIVSIDSQLNGLRNNLLSSLNNLKNSNEIQINLLSEQSSKINYRIASVPKNEREFKDIVRKQETKNTLYLFLLQKREESILAKSVSVDKAKILDSAFSNRRPVSPKKKVTYLAAILLGLLLPTAIIYIKDILDTKVHDEKDLFVLKIPYIGDIPEHKIKKSIFIKDGDTTNLAEAFRYTRTNIGFMMDSKKLGKTIFVTSTIKHEGKTVIAINLAFSLAISGKKTLLLGMDLRAPAISKYLKFENKIGVSNYITDKMLIVDDIVLRQVEFSNLDIINSGNIPPNPVELLMSKRVEDIFRFAKDNYEYIIVDTAPVGLVTDTMQISKYGDMTIYVVKANFLDKRMLHIPEKLNKEQKLPKMAILINGSDYSKGNYGYGYGYGNKKKQPWYKKLFN